MLLFTLVELLANIKLIHVLVTSKIDNIPLSTSVRSWKIIHKREGNWLYRWNSEDEISVQPNKNFFLYLDRKYSSSIQEK